MAFDWPLGKLDALSLHAATARELQQTV